MPPPPPPPPNKRKKRHTLVIKRIVYAPPTKKKTPKQTTQKINKNLHILHHTHTHTHTQTRTKKEWSNSCVNMCRHANTYIKAIMHTSACINVSAIPHVYADIHKKNALYTLSSCRRRRGEEGDYWLKDNRGYPKWWHASCLIKTEISHWRIYFSCWSCR